MLSEENYLKLRLVGAKITEGVMSQDFVMCTHVATPVRDYTRGTTRLFSGLLRHDDDAAEYLKQLADHWHHARTASGIREVYPVHALAAPDKSTPH